jgi:4-hydroxybenzoate polyprenyltransferase
MPGLPDTGGGAAAGAVQSPSAWWLTSLLGAAALALALATIKRRLDR